MYILIAPNAFKNSLTAPDVAEALASGLLQAGRDFTIDTFPVGDGGDGTASLLGRAARGRKISLPVRDPLGRITDSFFMMSADGQTAFIEMADASGLRMLGADELDPFRASSHGTGELVLAALNAGVKEIVLCLGGSATVDGGAGLLQALGVRFLDSDGNELNANPHSLSKGFSVDTHNLDPRVNQTKFVVLCDVDNVLLGKNGAAAVFGPQKGANEGGVQRLDRFLSQMDEAALAATGQCMSSLRHGGAAGGVAAAVAVFLNARLVPGADYFLDYCGFDEQLAKADLVITGEGSLDIQTLEGKAPFAVASRARRKNVPVIGIAGKIGLTDSAAINEFFTVLVPIGNQPDNLETAIANTHQNLVRTGKMIGKLISLKNVINPESSLLDNP